MAAEIAEAVDDQLRNGLLAHGDQRLGQNFGVGVQPRAKAPGHHHDGDIDALAVVDVQLVGKHNVGDDAALVQNRQRVDAVGLQHLPRAAALGNGQAQRVVVGCTVDGLVRRAAAQKEFADIAVGQRGLQPPFRRNKQDALAGLVQLAQRLQHGGVGRQKQFLYPDQRQGPPFGRWFYSASTAWHTRSQSSSVKLVEQGRLTMYRR